MKMEAFKIILTLLFCGYSCDGHYIMRNYQNSRATQGFPSLDFQTFPEYFKPLYRIRYPSPSTTAANRIQPHTPKLVNINNNKQQATPLKNHGNGMLSIIKNVMKPLMGKMQNPVNQPPIGRGTIYENHRNHAIHLKLIPKLVKKEVAKQLGTILGKMSKDTVVNNTKQEINKTEERKVDAIDLTNNKENASTEYPKLNETNEDEIKKKTGYINKIEAKSIFGNFVGNKHFANIFIFYPNNDNSALVVGLKDNLTEMFTENPAEILTKIPIEQLVDTTTEDDKEESLVNEDDKDLVGTKDNESSNDEVENTAASTEVTVTTDSITLTSAATVTTTENQGDDNKNAVGNKHPLSGDKDDVDQAVKDDDSKMTESSSTTRMSSPTTTKSLNTSNDDDSFFNKMTESPSKDLTEELNDKIDELSTVATSTVVNKVSESTTEGIKNVEDGPENEKKIDDGDNSEIEDKIKENDTDTRVAPTTELSQAAESNSENTTEKLNEIKDEETINSQEIDELDDTVNETTVSPKEPTVAPDTTPSTTEDTTVTSTEVTTSVGSNVDITTNTESKSKGTSDSTESTTIELGETLSTGDGESTTQKVEDTEKDDNSIEGSADGDYMEIEYTYF